MDVARPRLAVRVGDKRRQFILLRAAHTIGRVQSVPPIGMASMRLMTSASLMRGEIFTRVMPGSPLRL
jgi:hypothetical protein